MGSDDGGSSSAVGPAIGAVVGILVVGVLGFLYVRSRKGGGSRDTDKVAFSNPMYDVGAGTGEGQAATEGAYADIPAGVPSAEDHAYAEPVTMATGGYMDVPAAGAGVNAGAGGYMDVAAGASTGA